MPTRRSALLSLVSGTIGAGVCLGSKGRKQVAGSNNSLTRHSGSKTSLALNPIRFRNVASSAGLGFVLQNNPTPRKHLIETMPGGVAAFDYNGDGLTDIYFTNGAARYYVLRRITAEVKEGEFVTIMGPSGAGKSTLLSILGMLDASWTGEFYFLDHAIHKMKPKQRAEINKKYIGFVFQ